MSDVKNENRVSDLRVVCYGEASIKKILPKSGNNAGKEITVLSMRAYHPKSVRKPDGTFDQCTSRSASNSNCRHGHPCAPLPFPGYTTKGKCHCHR